MNSNYNHIVFLTPGFAQNEQDTTTISAIQTYVKSLKKRLPELKITIITFQFPFITERYIWFGCTVIPLNGGNKKHKKLITWKRSLQKLKQLNKENDIDIIHSFWLGECAFIGNYFSKKNNIKHICTLMGQDVKKNNLFLKWLPLPTISLVCISEIQQQHFLKKYSRQVRMISWGINKTLFPNSMTKTIDIIGVGSLIPLKNFELFIDVIFEVNKSTALKVLLIGEGVEKEKLQLKIKNLKLENNIILTGLLDYKDTLDKMSKAKVLLHTSNFESFGMIFPEALQSKTIIVSKKVGCVYPNENWFICETKEEMVLACKKALISNFYENNSNPFIIENTVENYLKLYNE